MPIDAPSSSLISLLDGPTTESASCCLLVSLVSSRRSTHTLHPPGAKGTHEAHSQWDWQIGPLAASLYACMFLLPSDGQALWPNSRSTYCTSSFGSPQGVANIPSKVSCSQRGLYNFLVCLHCCTGYKLFLWTPG